MSIKVYDKVAQGTEEWFKLKWAKVGGTASSGLFTESETLFLSLLGDSVEDFQLDESFQSKEMLRGSELEPVARQQLSEYTGHNFIEVGWIQNLDRKLLGISPDGITSDFTIGCEIKCLGAKNYLKTVLEDKIPREHIHQCIHYFTVNPKLQHLYYCCFRPENKLKPLFVKELTRDTMVDIGRVIKGKIKEDRGNGIKDYVCNLPDMKTVSEWVKIAEIEADKIKVRLNESIIKLNF